jgi:hypothetical protein
VVIVKLESHPDLSGVEAMPRGAARKTAAFTEIERAAAQSQKPGLAIAQQLKDQGLVDAYHGIASPDVIIIDPKSPEGRAKVIAAFQSLEGVHAIYDNNATPIAQGPGGSGPTAGASALPGRHDSNGRPAAPQAGGTPGVPHNLEMIGAPDAWAQGADGHGLVYGSIDSGVDVSHPSLAPNYRGTNADGSQNNDYNWFDPLHRSAAPKDFEGHGTGTTGVAVGTDTGAAPKSKFIVAVGREGGTPALRADTLLDALNWMLAPTKVDGSAPDATKAPDVIGMSWSIGPPSSDLFDDAMRNLRAAGIEPVKSAGNLGPGANTLGGPAANDDLIAVGAVDPNGIVTNFSSRGSTKPGGRVKPDFAAPGLGVHTTQVGGGYGEWQGTSVAQPHVSGAILDILSKYPNLTHDQLYDVLERGATDKGAPGADPEYGNGIINVPRSLKAARDAGHA